MSVNDWHSGLHFKYEDPSKLPVAVARAYFVALTREMSRRLRFAALIAVGALALVTAFRLVAVDTAWRDDTPGRLVVALVIALVAAIVPVTLQGGAGVSVSRLRRVPIGWVRTTLLLVAFGFAWSALEPVALNWKTRLILGFLALAYGAVFAQIAAHRHLAPMLGLRRMSFFGCGVLAGLAGYVMMQGQAVLEVSAAPLPWHPPEWDLPAFTHTAVVALAYAVECAFRLGKVERVVAGEPNSDLRRRGTFIDAAFFAVWLVAFTVDLAHLQRVGTGVQVEMASAVVTAITFAALLALSIAAAAVPVQLYWRKKKIAARFPVPVVAAVQGSLEQRLEELADDFHEGRVDEVTYKQGHAELVARLGHHGAED